MNTFLLEKPKVLYWNRSDPNDISVLIFVKILFQLLYIFHWCFCFFHHIIWLLYRQYTRLCMECQMNITPTLRISSLIFSIFPSPKISFFFLVTFEINVGWKVQMVDFERLWFCFTIVPFLILLFVQSRVLPSSTISLMGEVENVKLVFCPLTSC